jgi:serine/threonine protein kinase
MEGHHPTPNRLGDLLVNDETIFTTALEKSDPTERAAYLAEVCGEDSARRQRIEELLAAHGQASDFLERPAVESAALQPAPTRTVGGPSCNHDDAAVLALLVPGSPGSLGRLGHYEVQKVVGRGAFGTVLKAFDERLRRVVAIKVLSPHLASSGMSRQRFQREARSAAAVRNDFVINIHGVSGDDAPVPYLVMEYVDGRTLKEKLNETGSLGLKEVLRIGHQIASGLAAAHKQGVIHRDIKPANILLENGVERVKLTDFGLARAVADASLTQSGVVSGTPMYMSPEQAQGNPVDHRSDLFSLGSVLYAMCIGHPPFRAETTLAVMKRVAEENPRPIRELNPEVPVRLADLVAQLLAKKPGDRHQTAQEVAELLAEDLAELQNPVVRFGKVQRRPKQGRSGRWKWTVAALALLLVCGVGLTESTGLTHLLRGSAPTPILPDAGRLSEAPSSSRVDNPATADEGDSSEKSNNKERAPLRPVRSQQGIPPKGLRQAVVSPSGRWKIEGDDLVQQDSIQGGSVILFGDSDWTDFAFSAEAKSVGGSSCQLVYRAASLTRLTSVFLRPQLSNDGKGLLEVESLDPNDGHGLKGDPGGFKYEIYNKPTTPVDIRDWHTIKVIVSGERCSITVNGGGQQQYDQLRHPAGMIGFRTYGGSSRFRNIKVSDLRGKILWDGLPELP